MAARRKSTRSRSTARPLRPKTTKSRAVLVENVQQVWLAGMGAIARAQKEGPAAFQDAVADGLKLLNRSRAQTAEEDPRRVRDRAIDDADARRGRARTGRETWDNLEALFQSRVQKAMRQIGVPNGDEIRLLIKRVARAERRRAEARRQAGATGRTSSPAPRRGRAAARKRR